MKEKQNAKGQEKGKGIVILQAVLLADDGALMLIPNQDLNQSEELAVMYDSISELAKADAATIRETIERNRQARDN